MDGSHKQRSSSMKIESIWTYTQNQKEGVEISWRHNEEERHKEFDTHKTHNNKRRRREKANQLI